MLRKRRLVFVVFQAIIRVNEIGGLAKEIRRNFMRNHDPSHEKARQYNKAYNKYEKRHLSLQSLNNSSDDAKSLIGLIKHNHQRAYDKYVGTLEKDKDQPQSIKLVIVHILLSVLG